MKIKDEYVLANHMGRALSNYANQVQNGNVHVFRGFLDGSESVDVTVTLHDDGSITMKPIEKLVEPKVEVEEPAILEVPMTEELRVKILNNPILTPGFEPIETPTETEPVIEKEKPKRARRKKKQSEN